MIVGTDGTTCDAYCESFGHVCKHAGESCDEEQSYSCDHTFEEDSDALCGCLKGAADATKAPDAPMCEPYSKWPDISDHTCTSCTAMVLTEPYEGKCEAYCQSFGHECARAAHPEPDAKCLVKKAYACDDTIPDTSVMMCTCQSVKTTAPTTTTAETTTTAPPTQSTEVSSTLATTMPLTAVLTFCGAFGFGL